MKILEEYVKKALKIPHCNFDGIHPKMAYEIIAGLSQMYEQYPFFNRVICSIGSVSDYIHYYNLIEFSMLEKWNKGLCEYNSLDEYKNLKESIYAFGKITNHYKSYYTSSVNSIDNIDFFMLVLGSQNQIYPDNIDDIIYKRMCVYHEFGHLLDTFLHISNNPNLDSIIKGHDIEEEISNYACQSKIELVAEAFALYKCTNNELSIIEKRIGTTQFNDYEYEVTPLVNEIGHFIDDEYIKFIKNNKTRKSREEYKFNERFFNQKYLKRSNIDEIEENIKMYIKK